MPFASLAACFASGLLLALVVIPPWQNPDEPQHLLTTRLVMRHGSDFVLDRDTDPASERAIVASMARYGWWGHYGHATPDPLPSTFASGPALVVQQYFGAPGGGSRLYYRGMAALFDTVSIGMPLSQLYVMRLVSAFASILSLWCIWSGMRAVLNERAAAAVTALIALHPQVVIVSTSASPDAFVNLAGSIVWRQAALLLSSPTTLVSLAMLWGGAVAALVLRRMGAPLIAIAGLVTAFVICRALTRERAWRAGLGAALVVATALVAVIVIAAADFNRAIDFIRVDPSRALSATVANAERLPAFFDMFFRTFWLAAGWLRYQGPAWWHLVTIVISVVAGAGLIVMTLRKRSTPLWLAIMMMAIQGGAVVAYHFGIVQSGPQGRYLFPVLPAIFCLIWLGWNTIVGGGRRARLAATSLVAVMALLNISAWVFVVLPAYL